MSQDELQNYKKSKPDAVKLTNETIVEDYIALTQKNVTNNGLSFKDINYISFEDHQKIYKRSNVSKGDILISMIGANRGMSCLVENEKEFSIKNDGLIKPSYKFVTKYILNYLKSEAAQDFISSMSKGGAQEFVNLTSLRSFSIPLPPLAEQEAIVAQIEKEQTLVNANKELITIYQQKIKDEIGKLWLAD